MIIGYSLLGRDNDSFFIQDENEIDAPVCKKCGYLLDFTKYYNPFFRIKRKTYDVSFTYDLRCIVSLKFKEWCIREKYENLIFKDFELESSFFHFMPKKIVPFDHERRKTEFIKNCEKCGNYQEVIGATPAFLKNITMPLLDGFYRTDLLFGSGNRKQPLIIIGLETYNKIKKEKMKGLILDPIQY